ncbi:MAG: hypothetical protein Kow0031_23600 [Anaerolineae bacterium]
MLISFLLITVADGACVFIGPSSPEAGRVAHLPTLTRTPLPTLTPTAAVAASAATEIAVAAIALPLPSEPAANPAAPATATPAAVIPHEAGPAPPATVPPTATTAPVINLPTAEPTASATPSATATPLPTATATPPPSPSPTVTPTYTPTPLPDWVFSGVNRRPSPDANGVLLVGQVMNNTGASQELTDINGTFYDAQGQVINLPGDTYAYWPGYVLPHGGSMPFELAVDGVASIANFDLGVTNQPSDKTPQQNFEFLNVTPQGRKDSYCLQGELRNPGSPFQDYLLIAAILFNNQDEVIGFGEYQEFGHTQIAGDRTARFEICVDQPGQDVARYELQAWGR